MLRILISRSSGTLIYLLLVTNLTLVMRVDIFFLKEHATFGPFLFMKAVERDDVSIIC